MRRRAVEKEGTFFGAVGLESPACFFREPSPSSSPCTFRLSVECHQFLIELSVRPSRSLAISAQRLPWNSTLLSIPLDRNGCQNHYGARTIFRCASRTVASSAAVQALRTPADTRQCHHLSRTPQGTKSQQRAGIDTPCFNSRIEVVVPPLPTLLPHPPRQLPCDRRPGSEGFPADAQPGTAHRQQP